jgi:GPH family glycoside/pentoside/hexuronide:cation symporter
MGTPWLIFLAGLEIVHGPGGDLVAGMRFLSLLIAALLIPLSVWWFFALKEPRFAVAKKEPKSSFWEDMRTTLRNRTFLQLVSIIFTLALGFNFVSIFSQYITIFYVYGGDVQSAGWLLGANGTIWGVTAMAAVFPLNWLSHRLGKNKTLLVAILLMCAAQLAKIVCYDPRLPYLILIPTVLLSSGMLMFFTLGSSMLGDICDEDELVTGTRNEGSYYSVYWWFMKLGNAFAGFVMGTLLVFTGFDERQNVLIEAVGANISAIKSNAEVLKQQEGDAKAARDSIAENILSLSENSTKLHGHLAEQIEERPDQVDHLRSLIQYADAIRARTEVLREKTATLLAAPTQLLDEVSTLTDQERSLRKQTPATLFHLRLFEIGVPLIVSVVSILLTSKYPLTEARCYEIKQALEARREKLASTSRN